MTNLTFTEEETMLADMARGFLDDNAPVAHLRAMRDEGRRFDADLWSGMAQMGWTGILVPEEAGGSDMGHAAAGILAAEMGKTLTTSPFISTAVMAATALRQLAGDHANGMLRQIAEGTMRYAIAVDEGRKFAPENTEMQASRSGNGFRLNGRKVFVDGGTAADRVLVLALVDDDLTLFDIPADRDGLTRQATELIDARDSATFDFADVEVSGDEVLGQVGEGFDLLSPALQAGQAALAAEMTGLSASALGQTTAYLKERKQFGVPIGAFQALQHRAAHLWSEIEVTASTIIHAGRQMDADPESATLAVSLAKARATDTAQLAVQEAVQMHGGMGMTDAFDLGFFMKRARVSAEWLGDYGYHAARVAELRGF